MNAQSYIGNKEIIDGLTKVLADTFVLYFKTHSFHWNVVGPRFKSLHELFEEQYTELWNATDEIAERIRALDGFAPNTFKDILDKASLTETGQTPDADSMLEILANDNEQIVGPMHKLVEIAQDAGDEVTADMMIGRITVHQQAAWMLKSMNK